MNARDLENIHWTLSNGQTHERIQLLSLISQILELTSNAMSNNNDSSPHRRRRVERESRNTAYQHKSVGPTASTLQRENSTYDEIPIGTDHISDETFQFNGSRSTPHRREKTTHEGRTIAAYQKSTENSRSNGKPATALTIRREKSNCKDQGETSRNQLQTYAGLQQQTSRTPEDSHTSHQQCTDDDEMIQTSEILEAGSGFSNEQLSEDGNKSSRCNQGSRGSNDNSFDLNELLKSDVCADIMEYYEEHKRFDDVTQKKFMRIMCDELLKGPRVSNEVISQISDNVCLVFGTEDKKESEDEILAEIKKVRTELGSIAEYNYEELKKLQKAAKDEMKRLEVKRKLDAVDQEIIEMYKKIGLIKQKRRPLTKQERDEVFRLTEEQKRISDQLEAMPIPGPNFMD